MGNLYLNSLAPWEEKKQYLEIVKLGTSLKEQTEAIQLASKQQFSKYVESNNELTSQVISNQKITNDLIKTEIKSLYYSIGEISEGLQGLQSSFEWGIASVVWQIEQNRTLLLNILDVLKAPLDTQAKELRTRAQEAFSNGWFDDAEIDYLESEEKNRYDFTVHISLGLIYLFHKINKEKALEYFEKAIKYAKPKSNYYTSYALLHKALIMLDLNKVEEAERATQEAITLSPDLREAYYQNAQYNALLGNTELSFKSLIHCVEYDINYLLKYDNDPLFEKCKAELNNSLENVRKEFAERTSEKLKISKNNLNSILQFLTNNSSHEKIDKDFDEIILEIEKQLSRIDQLENIISQSGIFDIYLIKEENNKEIRDEIKIISENIKEKLSAKLEEYSVEIKSYCGFCLKDEDYGFSGSIYKLKEEYQKKIQKEEEYYSHTFGSINEGLSAWITVIGLVFLPLISISIFLVGLYAGYDLNILIKISVFLLIPFFPILIRRKYTNYKYKKLEKLYNEEPEEVINALATVKLIQEKRDQLSKFYWQFESFSKEINSDKT